MTLKDLGIVKLVMIEEEAARFSCLQGRLSHITGYCYIISEYIYIYSSDVCRLQVFYEKSLKFIRIHQLNTAFLALAVLICCWHYAFCHSILCI